MGWIHGSENSYSLGFGSDPEPRSQDPELLAQEKQWKDAVDTALVEFSKTHIKGSWEVIAKEKPDFLDYLSEKSGIEVEILNLNTFSDNVLTLEYAVYSGVRIPEYGEFVDIDCIAF